MFDLIRRHCFLLAAAVLVWQGWTASTPGASGAGNESADEAPLPPPLLNPESLELRAAGVAPLAASDPFFLRELLLHQAAAQLPAEAAAAGTDSGTASAPESQAISPSVRLTLQSTLPDGPRGRAWINGHDLGIGDTVPGIVAASPPVLKAVVGCTVTIGWGGRDYLLDLYGAAAVELSGSTEEAE